MKIWLDQNYNIINEQDRNFGRGNNYFDFIEVYILRSSIETDNVIPTFLFETPVQKCYGPFAHDTPTWFDGEYTVFKLTLNDAILSENGELKITIALNFFKNEAVIKTKRVTCKGFVIDNIIVHDEIFIVGDAENNIESLNQKVDSYDARILALNIILNSTNENLVNLKNESKRFGKFLGEFDSKEEMYQSILNLFNQEDPSSIASSILDSYAYISFSNGKRNSFVIFNSKDNYFYSVEFKNDAFVEKKEFIKQKDIDELLENIKGFYELDNLNNVPVKAVTDYPGIFLNHRKEKAILLKRLGSDGIIHYVQTNTNNSITVYKAVLNDTGATYKIETETIIVIPKINVVQNPDESQGNPLYPRVIRINGIEYDLDFKKYTDKGIQNILNSVENTYAKLSSVYTKNEINEMIGTISGLEFIVIEDFLPDAATAKKAIYLFRDYTGPLDYYSEYIPVNGMWEKLGTTQVQLSGFVKKTVSINGIISQIINENGVGLYCQNDDSLIKVEVSPYGIELGYGTDGTSRSEVQITDNGIVFSSKDGFILEGRYLRLISRDGTYTDFMVADGIATINSKEILTSDAFNFTDSEIDQIMEGAWV